MNHAHVDDCEHIENPEGAWVKASDYDALAAEAQALRDERDSQQRVAIKAMEELAALRARVVVVPERDARRMDTEYPEGWNACLDELARLNGKTVSEGLLRKWLELMEHGDYREGHCMCGSPVDSHGIGDGHAPIDAGEYYAGQVMEELRALLNQDKENGNG
ncbi:TPA: hypothetical protein L4R51_002354 [Pseudomonas aeruginosa]|nr:hypothetical protein [Pseudomonas aeruginosa]